VALGNVAIDQGAIRDAKVTRRFDASPMARQSVCGNKLYFAPLSTMNRTTRDPIGPVTTPST
jgi:hypothetical protein